MNEAAKQIRFTYKPDRGGYVCSHYGDMDGEYIRVSADDGEPLTEDWLWNLAGEGKAVSTAIGTVYRFRINEHSSLVVWARACGIGFTTTMRRIKRNEDGTRMTVFCDLVDVTTRGDLRRLCAALGIPLKDQA